MVTDGGDKTTQKIQWAARFRQNNKCFMMLQRHALSELEPLWPSFVPGPSFTSCPCLHCTPSLFASSLPLALGPLLQHHAPGDQPDG